MVKEPRPETPLLEAKRRVVLQASGLAWVALGLLDRPQRWTRRAYALDTRGRSVRVDDPAAARFCLAGALLRAEHDRYGTEMPLRTSDEAAVDDLLEPVLPPDPPLRLRLALQVLALASRWQLERLGRSFRAIDPGEEPERARQVPTALHLPLLLGLERRGGYERCSETLVTAAVALARIASDDEWLNQALPDDPAALECEQ